MPIQQGPRNELVFEWDAEYIDGTHTKQYDDEKDEEHHFGHINQETLRIIHLRSKRDGTVYSLNFQTGLFSCNGVRIEGTGLDYSERDRQVKLILFRRIKRVISPDLTNTKSVITYFLGWEGRVEGKFYKHGLQIFEDSSYAIPPEDSFHAL